jgi:peroxiredoxin
MAALEPGSIAPEFVLPDSQGQTHSLSEGLAGGPVLLVFFKISCPTSQYALPFYERLHRRLAGSSLKIWAVSQDSLDHTNAFARHFGVETLPALFDPEEEGYTVSNAYGITNVPTAFLIGPGREVLFTSVGWSREDVRDIARRLGEHTALPNLELFEDGEKVIEFQPGCGSKN